MFADKKRLSIIKTIESFDKEPVDKDGLPIIEHQYMDVDGEIQYAYVINDNANNRYAEVCKLTGAIVDNYDETTWLDSFLESLLTN